MMYNNATGAFGAPTMGYPGYPNTVVNPINEKPAVSTLTEKEEKILASTGGNEFIFTEEEIAVAHCNHAPSPNGQNVLILESDDGTVAKFRCNRCHATFEVDRRITEEDVSKVCEFMNNVLHTIKTYFPELPNEFAKNLFTIQAAFPKIPKVFNLAKNSIPQKVAAYNQQFQNANVGAFYGQPNPYQTAFANGLTSPSAQYQYNQYAQAAYPTFNGNGMPQQAYYNYTGQPMAGAPVQNPYGQMPQMSNPYAPQAGAYSPAPVGGIMTADAMNPLYAAQSTNAATAPAGTGTFSVPAPPNNNVGLSFSNVQPSQVVTNPAPAATPQMTIPTVGNVNPAAPPVSNPAPAATTPTATPNVAPATPVGGTASITL